MKEWLATQAGAESASDFGDRPGEIAALTSGCALWIRSGWRLHALGGEKRVDFLHGYITQEVRREPGQGAYGCLLTVKGGLVADVWTLLRQEDLLLLSAPAAGPGVIKHLKRYALLARVSVDDLSESHAVFSLIGPQSADRARLLCSDLPEGDLEHRTFEHAGASLTLVRNDWLGVEGYDVIVPIASGEALASELIAAGATRVGRAAITARRVTAGIPIYGVDMHEKTLPLEAGLEERAISYDKGCYTGQEVIVRIKHRGKINRHLRGLRLSAAPPDALPVALYAEGGKEVSALTSVALTPDGARGLALIHRKYPPGTTLYLGAVGGPQVEVCELPFE
ncbi:MAG: hypothetical protein JKY65_15795 [Planctomycetes bacterium]|nr:hypothetical protein [Planctomycetota bacterium]